MYVMYHVCMYVCIFVKLRMLDVYVSRQIEWWYTISYPMRNSEVAHGIMTVAEIVMFIEFGGQYLFHKSYFMFRNKNGILSIGCPIKKKTCYHVNKI